METAYAYARVSTEDQDKKGSSIPEQLLRIQNFASDKGIKITRTYQDTSSAYHDENRVNFNQMIADALKEKPNCIIVDDSSRFSRDRGVSAATKKLLRKNHVEVLFASEENVDPRTSAGLWLDGIRDLKNEAYSLDISHSVIRGMSGNVKQRDPETGWCYKNGGRVPYGYQAVKLTRGYSKGKPIIKTIWEPHPENSKIARMIIVDLYSKQGLSYDKIMDYLHEKKIPGPEGRPWGRSTIVEMLKEERLEQYAGTAIWNKYARRTKNKQNPREEWVILENAHPAIITKEELETALARKNNNKRDYTVSRTKDSPYLFTGKNLEGKHLFTCSACGGHMIGYRPSSRHARKYICANINYYKDAVCQDKLLVDMAWLEKEVVNLIEDFYTTPENIEKLIKDVKEDLQSGCTDYYSSINELTKQKNTLETQKDRLLNAIKAGINPSLVMDEANKLTEEINDLTEKIKLLKDNPPNELDFDEEEIRRFFTSFTPTFTQGTNEERKTLVRTFIRNIELDPKKKEVRVTFYPDLLYRIGVGDGT